MTPMGDQLAWFFERVKEYLLTSFLSWDNFVEALGRIPQAFISAKGQFGWLFVLSSLFVAGILYVMAKREGAMQSLSFREFVFPSLLYRHPSSRLDRRFAIVEVFMNALFYVPVMSLIALLGTKAMTGLLTGWWAWEPPKTLSPAAEIGAGLAFLLLHDFITFFAHLCFHKVPWLWTFHRVHHSAEVLTPVAAFRVHPVENFTVATLQAPAVGLAMVFYRDIVTEDIQFTLIFGINAVTFLLAVAGSHLRHSHLWLSFGPLNKIFMSPAHHVIHHSVEARHLDKNFGVKFPFWDALFGTLYEPKRQEALHVGLTEPSFRPFESVTDLYVRPFSEVITSFRLVPKRILANSRVLQGRQTAQS